MALRLAPPMRAAPDQPDEMDGQRCAYFTDRWHQQDDVLRPRDRQIEENIRMLCGQQWTVWNPVMQKWIDITGWFGDPDRYWRQRPVVNRLAYWFILTHARMTENPSTVSFQPANPDRSSAQLADVMDTVYKTVWQTAGMDDANDMAAAWLIPSGEVYLINRIDPQRGPLKPWIGPAMLPLQDELGQPVIGEDGQPVEMYAEQVPYGPDGQPRAQLQPDGSYVATGEPHYEHEGEIVTDVLSALQVRGEWSQKPWHRRRWHMMYSYTSLEDIYELFKVEVTEEGEAKTGSGMELARLQHGSGWYGAAGNRQGEGVTTFFTSGFAGVYTYWERPSEQYPETPDSPGGRLWIGTKTKTLYDGPRNAAFPYTSPLRQYKFVNLPGRPAGSSPQEAMNPLQRQYNRGWAQIMEYRNLCVNPIGVIDQNSGIRDKEIVNKPGLLVTALRRTGVPAIEYINPPRLGEEVFRTQELLLREMKDFGNIEGAEGSSPTTDASGELVKELRWNSDRFIGPTQRRKTVEDGRLVEDQIALTKIIWNEAKVITYAGEDNIPQTVAVFPEMFEYGRVNVVPSIESALPEGRGEKIKRAQALYNMMVWGPPGSPEAGEALLDMLNFPDMKRSGMVGGVDKVTASQENGQMALGAPAQMIETFEWMNHGVHLMIHERYMSSPEFKKLDPQTKMQFALHRQIHLQYYEAEQQAMMEQQLAMAEAQGGGQQNTNPPAQA